MPRTIEVQLYKFAELSDKAKEKAREWWRDLEGQDFGTDGYLYDPYETAAKLLGIELDTRPVKLMGGGTRYEPKISYSGFWSQGDGASFEGTYHYKPGSHKQVRKEFPEDKELHRIADDLLALEKKHGYKLDAKVTRGHGSNFYSHSGTMDVDTFRVDADGYEADAKVNDEDRDEMKQLMRDFADYIYRGLEQEYEWRMADEQVDDSIIANEYEFTEDGEIS